MPQRPLPDWRRLQIPTARKRCRLKSYLIMSRTPGFVADLPNWVDSMGNSHCLHGAGVNADIGGDLSRNMGDYTIGTPPGRFRNRPKHTPGCRALSKADWAKFRELCSRVVVYRCGEAR